MAEAGHAVKASAPGFWERQQRRIGLWAPVCLAGGIAARFGWDGPALWPLLALLPLLIVGAGRARYLGLFALWAAAMAAALGLAGALAAEWRMARVTAPVLAAPFTGEVEGRVRQVDRSRSGSPRVLLDEVALRGVDARATPARVRVTLVRGPTDPRPGDMLRMRAALSAPAGPAEPGGFDFSRRAFFRGIGAVGYTRGKVERLGAAEGFSPALALDRFRADLAAGLRARIDGEAGAVAAALVVGDRSGIAAETLQALRDSGLAHLLAISGLHIGLMSALTYWLLRAGLAFFPVFASRVPIRKIAALGGLLAAGIYLLLSGNGVATQRAFLMAAVAFGGILIDRPAVTMRGLAFAACVILLLRPESLFEPGFQMSFAAVTVLVAGYEATRGLWQRRAMRRGIGARLGTFALATLATSAMAGLATAPFAAWHFNRLVAFGLAANLLATPAMGLWIMPAIIAAAVLAPFGLEGVALEVLGAGIRYILAIAQSTADLPGAVRGVRSGPGIALGLIAIGGVWGAIWLGRLRLLGIGPILAGLVVWAGAPRPDLLIAGKGALVAARLEDGTLWLSREKAAGYAAQTWLRRDGDVTALQVDGFARREWRCSGVRCEGWTDGGWRILLIRKGKLPADDCAEGTVAILPYRGWDGGAGPHDCLIFDRARLTRLSSAALYLAGDDARIVEAAPFRIGR